MRTERKIHLTHYKLDLLGVGLCGVCGRQKLILSIFLLNTKATGSASVAANGYPCPLAPSTVVTDTRHYTCICTC